MSPKGPLAPAPSASEIRKERRWGFIILVSFLLAMIPLLLVVLGYYPPADEEVVAPSADSLANGDDSAATEVPGLAADSTAPLVSAETVWWRKARAQLFALLKDDEEDDTPSAPLPPAHSDTVLPPPAAASISAPSAKAGLPASSAMKPAASSSSRLSSSSAQKPAPASVAKSQPPPSRIVILPDPERDSVRIVFRAPLAKRGVLVQGDLLLFSTEKGASSHYPAFAPAIQIALENIFYITQPENLKIPRLEAQLLQKVGFVFPQGAITRVELRNLHTEWENR
jgi:hypothetical protein